MFEGYERYETASSVSEAFIRLYNWCNADGKKADYRLFVSSGAGDASMIHATPANACHAD